MWKEEDVGLTACDDPFDDDIIPVVPAQKIMISAASTAFKFEI